MKTAKVLLLTKNIRYESIVRHYYLDCFLCRRPFVHPYVMLCPDFGWLIHPMALEPPGSFLFYVC